MKKIFVPDGNWYLWRAFHTNRSIQSLDEVIPYQLLNMICKDALAVQADYVIVAFDGPRVFRHKIYPQYKANRTGRENDGLTDAENADPGESIRDKVYGCLPAIFSLFDKIGLTYYMPKIYEADDVLCSIAKAYGEQYKVICGTQDKDAYQYLSDVVWLYDASAKGKDGKRKPKYIRPKDAERIKGVKIKQMVAYQTLIGDKLDNIMPIKGMTPSKVKKILNEHGSINRWAAADKEAKRFLTIHTEHIRLNRRLVTLVDQAIPPGRPEEWRLRKKKAEDSRLSRTYHDFHARLYPKSHGLF